MAELSPGIETPAGTNDTGYTFNGVAIEDSMAQMLAMQKEEAQRMIATQTLSAMINNRKQAGMFIASKM